MPNVDNGKQTNRPCSVLELVDFARSEAEQASLQEPAARRGPLPDCFPGYTVIREIHRGGQGVVYEAVQRNPKRKVAIKVLRSATFADRMDHVRLQREAEMLARIKHPNIVGVIEAGMAEELPYFVMDFIDGEPFDAYLRGNRQLAIEDSVRLFVKICNAVHAAHLQGVVHRDLKPGNILVDAASEPHVFDFGLGRQTQESSKDGPSITCTGQFVGSLAWSSPEQVDARLGSVDIRTDVYSLGVVLYWSLTGEFPYDVHGPVHAVTARIAKTDSPRPSTVRKGIDDDLDTIVLKCLAKDRERRYQSAGDLARDLERYLQQEAIDARRDSTIYVLSRIVRRHRKVVATMSAFLVLLVAGVIVTFSLYVRSNNAELQASRRYGELRRLLDSIILDFDANLRKGPTAAREFYDTTAVAYLLGLADEAEADADLIADVVAGLVKVADVQGNASYANLGDAETAAKTLQTARLVAEDGLKKFPDDDAVLTLLATVHERIGDMRFYLDGGSTEEAAQAFQECRSIRESLLQDHPRNSTAIRDLASVLLRIGNMELEVGRSESAAAAYKRSLELRRQWVAMGPDDREARLFLARGLRAVGDSQHAAGDGETATISFANAQEVLAGLRLATTVDAEAEHEQIRLLSRLGHLARDRGEHTRALAYYTDCEDMAKVTSRTDPDDLRAVEDAWQCSCDVARSLARMGRYDEAMERATSVLRVAEDLARRSQGTKSADAVVAYSHQLLGQLCLDTGELDAALTNLDRCRDLLEEQRAKDGTLLRWQHSVCGTYFAVGETHRAKALRAELVGSGDVTSWQAAYASFAKSLIELDDLTKKTAPSPGVPSRQDIESRIAEASARVAGQVYDEQRHSEAVEAGR